MRAIHSIGQSLNKEVSAELTKGHLSYLGVTRPTGIRHYWGELTGRDIIRGSMLADKCEDICVEWVIRVILRLRPVGVVTHSVRTTRWNDT